MKSKSIGVIECGGSGEFLEMNQFSEVYGNSITKAFITDKSLKSLIKSRYPDVELVADTASIIKDSSIDFIIMSSPQVKNSDFIKEILDSGKHLQIL